MQLSFQQGLFTKDKASTINRKRWKGENVPGSKSNIPINQSDLSDVFTVNAKFRLTTGFRGFYTIFHLEFPSAFRDKLLVGLHGYPGACLGKNHSNQEKEEYYFHCVFAPGLCLQMSHSARHCLWNSSMNDAQPRPVCGYVCETICKSARTRMVPSLWDYVTIPPYFISTVTQSIWTDSLALQGFPADVQGPKIRLNHIATSTSSSFVVQCPQYLTMTHDAFCVCIQTTLACEKFWKLSFQNWNTNGNS